MRSAKRQRRVLEFLAARSPQADAPFISGCGLPDHPQSERVALAVRASVARSCGVESSYVYADDRFYEELGPLWGEDSLDFMDFHLDLELRFGVRLPDKDAERIKTPFRPSRTVADVVRNVLEVFGPRLAAQQGD